MDLQVLRSSDVGYLYGNGRGPGSSAADSSGRAATLPRLDKNPVWALLAVFGALVALRLLWEAAEAS